MVRPSIAPALLSIKHSAAYMDSPEETVRYWLKQGRFPKVKIGRRVFIRREDLDRYIATHVE